MSFVPTADRTPPDGAAPRRSVVILASGEMEPLGRCLESLAPVAEALGAEVLVVGAGLPGTASWRDTHANVRWIELPENAEPRQLRSTGLAAAHGDVVSLTDDRREMAGRWLERTAARQSALRVSAQPTPTDLNPRTSL